MKTITLAQLRKLDACEEQLARFEQLFGNSVTLSPELVQYAEDFNWDWAVENLLPKAARAEYYRIIDAAWDEYERATASARAKYWRGIDESLRVTAAAGAEYERVTAPAKAEYERVKAEVFLRLAMQY